MTADVVSHFNQLDLIKPLLTGLEAVGYETPSPIQAKTIPILLSGQDVVGQAQTGTGKTAAFALPVLNNLDPKKKLPQVLVLTPTRELAIQVAEAFKTYASHMKGFTVLPVYGGQDYRGQIKALQRGVQVIVGTPGRVMDHMKRSTLKLSELSTLVLDEADEMLRMGFIDDVEWILAQTPPTRQIALFSATMPKQIRHIATRYLTDPAEVTIKVKTSTAPTIRQRYWPVHGSHKLDTLTRILEAETFDAMIVFVRTKQATVELSEKLEARGYAAAPLSGDVPQAQRERTVRSLKNGKLDILVATDVAARGLDVDRISHVLNYDIPYDTEAYVHRIGRTGRAGRKGEAILFVAPREKRMLAAIERATNQKIEHLTLPSNDHINDRRIERFKEKITETIQQENLKLFKNLLTDFQKESEVDLLDIAAALAKQLQGDGPFLLEKSQKMAEPEGRVRFKDKRAGDRDERPSRNRRDRPSSDRRDNREGGDKRAARPAGKDKAPRSDAKPPRDNNTLSEKGMSRYRIEVGKNHDVKASNIVGAIANESGIESEYIGKIKIFDDHSVVDLPEGMPKAIFKKLKTVWVSGQRMQISKLK